MIFIHTGISSCSSQKLHMKSSAYAIKRIYDGAHIVNMKQTEIFHMLSEPLRLRALTLIAAEGELCVCELMHALNTPQPKVSRHMASMRDAGIMDSRRQAQWVFYTLNSSLSSWQKQIIDAAIAGVKTDDIARKDKRRLSEMKNRPERCNVL